MTAEAFPHGISPDPRYVLFVAIGTPDRIAAVKQAIHACGFAKQYEWSDPQPVADEPTKVMIALNRITP